MYLTKMLPIKAGVTFRQWVEDWLKEIASDLTSVIEDDPTEVRKRNERFGAYLPTLTTIIMIYRSKGREFRDKWYFDHPKPASGIREWEERRDSATSDYRYMVDFLTQMHGDIEQRISTSQTNLNFQREELRTNLD